MKKGDNVKFVDPDEDMVTLGACEDPSVYLKLGDTYTINSVDIHRWHTELLLNEMPGRWFNDRHFEELD